MLTRSLIATAAVLVVAAPPAAADPDNVRTATRTLECDDGRTVDARGVQGQGHDDLVTCEYMTGSGNHVMATGFFTPQRP